MGKYLEIRAGTTGVGRDQLGSAVCQALLVSRQLGTAARVAKQSWEKTLTSRTTASNGCLLLGASSIWTSALSLEKRTPMVIVFTMLQRSYSI
jgi:hypothetical protein